MAKRRLYVEDPILERPPAYQEYAAAALAAESIRLMSAAERGLLWSMRNYCWLNESVPVDPNDMARALGLTVDEVKTNFTPAVRSFFQQPDDEPSRLTCPALDRQMQRLMKRRAKQSQAGYDTARKRKEKKFLAVGKHDAEHRANHAATHDALEKNRTEKSRTENRFQGEANIKTPSQAKKNRGADVDAEWVGGYETAEVQEQKR